jgi:peptide chain release factor 3
MVAHKSLWYSPAPRARDPLRLSMISLPSRSQPEPANTGLAGEAGRRRTFAIISHPDAGKTTLTEKLLLYSGAIEQAGTVRARKNQRSATSDWMALERERGISITSTVLQFTHRDCVFNLLDTPGHQDFSEDTYRTLMAVDSAIMVLDIAKGIEPQTRRLFEVCRSRNIPILTFINKLDMPGKEPLAIIDEIDRTLNIAAIPFNWPVGTGSFFQGTYDFAQRAVTRFQRHARGSLRAPSSLTTLDDPSLSESLGAYNWGQLNEEIELLIHDQREFDRARFMQGQTTPVFFGSAVNNFGIAPFLEALANLAPSPRPTLSMDGLVDPADPDFSGFVFKIQANMDPRHRDSMAFMRVCSGRFEKDMLVVHPRANKSIRMSRPHRLFAQDRETVEVAYAGDVIGLANPGVFAIGDTVYAGKSVQFPPIPRFQPECFARLVNQTSTKQKQFVTGIRQLEDEGVIQVFHAQSMARREPILAAVGELQFDVVVARLAAEYGVDAQISQLSYAAIRWIDSEDPKNPISNQFSQLLRVTDRHNRLAILFPSAWDLGYLARQHPQLALRDATGQHMPA